MTSPLITALFHSNASLHTQLLLAAGALAVGLVLAVWVERRIAHQPSWGAALRAAVLESVALPAVALLGLQFVRHASPVLLHGALLKVVLVTLGVWTLVRLSLRVAHRVFPDNELAVLAARALNLAAWAGLLLHLSGALPEIIEALDAVSLRVGNQRLTGWTMLRGATWVTVTLLLSLWISSLLETRLMESRLEINIRLVLSRLMRAAIFTIGLLVSLQMVGINLTVLGVFGGALGVGLGLGLQRIAANYVSGFVILLERSLRVGDNVRLDTFQGKVMDIKTRYTVVRSPGGTESIVPNEMLISNRVENLSYTDPDVWGSTTVGIAYASDVEAALALLTEAARSVPRVLADPGPSAVISAFGDSSIEITIGYWIADPENGTLNVRGAVNLAVWRALKGAGIDIPFPQRVLQWAPGAAPDQGA